MKIETVKIYRCEFCRKYYSIAASATTYHEKRCNNNPKNQHACYGCDNLQFGYDEEGVKCLQCKVQGNKVMHSNKTVEKLLRTTIGGKPVGELMPYECKMFKFDGY